MEINYKKLFEELDNLKQNSFVPYSNFRVSSIIYLKNGKKICGVNIENASYPASICGERSAISSMISQGYKADDVEFMTLATDAEGFGSPCGICRQVLIELLNPNTKLLVFSKKGFEKELLIDELLPYAFTKEFLNK